MLNEKQRIDVLDLLRGIAALGVALFHFCNVLSPGIITAISFYGQLGVEVFFVISGFIIPYSLYRGGYTLRNYHIFIIKRITRLDPPYLVTLVLIILLGVLSWYIPFQKDLVFVMTLPQVLLHLGYVNVFFGYPWLSDVFWTLAIELQYYLLMGLIFPLIFSRRVAMRLFAFAGLGALSFIVRNTGYVFFFISLFLMGIATCQYWIGLIGKKQYVALLAASTLCALLTIGISPTIAGFATVCVILFLRVRNPVFHFLGNISYSLYLLHSPIGRRILNVLIRITGAQSQGAKLIMILLATGVSILAAYLLFRYVERPSQLWSASFRYQRERRSKHKAKLGQDEIEQLNPAL